MGAKIVGVLVAAVLTTTCAGGHASTPDSDGFVASEAEIALTVPTWVNMLGLNQLDTNVWIFRLERACREGVWDEDVAIALAAEFIAEDLESSPRPPGIDPPTPGEGATALWLMAIEVCGEEFPQDAVERGPPGL